MNLHIKDYNVLLLFYFYLQDNLYLQDNHCLQDNDNYPLSNLILNQIQTSKKRMSLIETWFLTREWTLALQIQISGYEKKDMREKP